MGEKFQSFLLVLRKLGILRYGVTTYKYTSGKDMPAHVILDDVYDEEKDLLSKDVFKKKSRDEKSAENLTVNRFCTQCGQEISGEARLCPACSDSVSK